MCYSCSLEQEFPERGPGPAGVTEREEEEEGGGVGEAPPRRLQMYCLHCNLI